MVVSKQASIFSAAFFIFLTTTLSYVLGLVKRRLIISFFGATSDPGVLEAAFRIPDFLFQILITSAVSSAFIPLFTEYLMEDKKKADKFASLVMNIGFVVYTVFSLIILLFTEFFSSIIAPGFSIQEKMLMTSLTRIIVISELFFVFGVIITAVLQSLHHFLIPGVASSFYNLGIILSTLLLAKNFGIYGVVYGVLIGSALFLIVQLPLLSRVGFKYSFHLFPDRGVFKLVHLMIPKSIVIFISQLAITANVIFASFISARSLFLFELAYALMMAPVFLFGQSIAQASFPSLSQQKNDPPKFVSIFLSSFYQILYLTLPISVILIVLRIPVVRFIYGADTFDWLATVITGRTLAYFAISISALSLTGLLSRAFYALRDTKTPLYVTLFSVILNVMLSYIFIMIFKQDIHFLALSSSLSVIVSLVLMILFLNQKVSILSLEFLLSVLKIVIASFIMGVFLYLPIKLLDRIVVDTTRTMGLLFLTGISSVLGLLTYLYLTWLFEIRQALYIINFIKSLGDWRKILNQITEPIESSPKA